MASSEIPSPDLSDKRRNKLGYHRTSVACGHCRRRKIRCLMAPDDEQRRCSNCIRLKKECNFYPVDQQPPLDRGLRNGSGADASSRGPTTSTTTSSPTYHSSGRVADRGSHFRPQRLQTNQDDENLYSSSASTMSPAGRTPMSGSSYHFPQTFAASPSWDQAPYISHSPQSFPVAEEPVAATVWGSNTFPMAMSSPQSRYPLSTAQVAVPVSSQADRAGFAARGVGGEVGWYDGSDALPMRSMSAATAGDMSAQYQTRAFPRSLAPGEQVAVSMHAGQAPLGGVLQHDMTTGRFGTLGQAGTPDALIDARWNTMPRPAVPSTGSPTAGLPRQWSGSSAIMSQIPPTVNSSPHDRRSTYGPISHRANIG